MAQSVTNSISVRKLYWNHGSLGLGVVISVSVAGCARGRNRPNAQTLPAGEEKRTLLLGVSFRLRVLVVCHCYRESNTVVRIISARKADKQEQEDYWN
jgi:hypothetical protein